MSKSINLTKNNGHVVEFSTENITTFLNNLITIHSTITKVDIDFIITSFESGLADGMSTNQIYELLASTLAYNGKKHHEYSLLAGRVLMASIQKRNDKSFSDMILNILNNMDEDLKSFVREHQVELDKLHTELSTNDFSYDYFAVKTLSRSYLMKDSDGKYMERPQHMWLRVATALWYPDLEKIKDVYFDMSNGLYTHATPTLYNAGTSNQQLASCYLLTMQDDSIGGIFDTLKQTALISKYAGGVGLSCSSIRGKGSYIKGTGGHSNGLIPMLKVFNDTARYVDQGGGKRKGSFAVFLEPWHKDILEFLELRLNQGAEELRTRDLFLALWMNDLFMERLKTNGTWTLFSPCDVDQLQDSYGKEFEKLYNMYEETVPESKKTQIPCMTIWNAISKSQIETGLPYIMFKDSCNEKSNQKNLGVIRNSNLCCEIVEYSSPDEVAVCTLASIALPKFVVNGRLDYDQLHQVSKNLCGNLNQIIDRNIYPLENAKRSNMKHRPIAIGVQGFHDLLQKLEIPFESEKANKLNSFVFETIQHGALEESNRLSQLYGSYESFKGSPASEGIMQHDMWKKDDTSVGQKHDWSTLSLNIIAHGLRNSLVTGQMPTASTSQILGNSESIDPIQSNLYNRRTLSGEFICLNKYLVDSLETRGLWNDDMADLLLAHKGSVQNITTIPKEVKEVFKTAFEIKMRHVIALAKTRGKYICQSQSMNLFFENPEQNKLNSALFYAWQQGLKTGSYYMRTAPASSAMNFTVDEKVTCESCSA